MVGGHEAEDVVVGHGERGGRAALGDDEYASSIGEWLDRRDLGARLRPDDDPNALIRELVESGRRPDGVLPGVDHVDGDTDGAVLTSELLVPSVTCDIERGLAGVAQTGASARDGEQRADVDRLRWGWSIRAPAAAAIEARPSVVTMMSAVSARLRPRRGSRVTVRCIDRPPASTSEVFYQPTRVLRRHLRLRLGGPRSYLCAGTDGSEVTGPAEAR